MTATPRRALLRALALLPVGLAVRPDWTARAAEAGLVAANVCLLSPETTEGPFYLDPRLVRRDITEGRPGVPLGLTLQVVDGDCRPLAGARVDVWHCDAAGDYSGVRQPGGRTPSARPSSAARRRPTARASRPSRRSGRAGTAGGPRTSTSRSSSTTAPS